MAVIEDDNDDDEPAPRRALTGPIPIVELPTPRTLFEHHVDERLDRAERRLDSLTASRRFWRWVAGLGIPAVVGAAVVISIWTVDKVTASSENVGETRAKIEGFRRTIDALDMDIRELRSRILKLSGVDSNHVTFDGKMGSLP